MNYNNRKFRVVSNDENGDVDDTMVFIYRQEGNVLSCSYSGGEVISGHLLGIVDEQGHIDMKYHHINKTGELMTGVCNSTPEILADGRIRLHESWQWTSGDKSTGFSILEEI